MTRFDTKLVPRSGLLPGQAEIRRLKQHYREFAVVGPALTGREALAGALRERLGSEKHGVKVFDAVPATWTSEQILGVYWIPGPAGANALRFNDVEIAAFFRLHQLGDVAKDLVEEIREHGRAVPCWLNALASTCLRKQIPLNDESWSELRAEADRIFCAEAVARLSGESRAILREATTIRYHHGRRGEVLRRMNVADLAMLQFHRVVDAEWRLDPLMPKPDTNPTLAWADGGRADVTAATPMRERMEFLDGVIAAGEWERAAGLIDEWMWDLLAECTVPEFCELTRLPSPHLSLFTFQMRAHWLVHSGDWRTGVQEIEERLKGVDEGSDDWIRLKAWLARVHRMGGEMATAIRITEETLKSLHDGHAPITNLQLLRERAHAIRNTSPDECADLFTRCEAINLGAIEPSVLGFSSADLESTKALWLFAKNMQTDALPHLEVATKIFNSIGAAPDSLLARANIWAAHESTDPKESAESQESYLGEANRKGAKFVAGILTDQLLRKAFVGGDFDLVLRISQKALLEGRWIPATVARRVIAFSVLRKVSEAHALIELGRRKGLFVDRYWKPLMDFYELLCTRTIFLEADWVRARSLLVDADQNAQVGIHSLLLETSLEQWRIEGQDSNLFRIGPTANTVESALYRDALVEIHRLLSNRRVMAARDKLSKIYSESLAKNYSVNEGFVIPFLALTYLATGEVPLATALLKHSEKNPNKFHRLMRIILTHLEGGQNIQHLTDEFVKAQPALLQDQAERFLKDCLSLCGIHPIRRVVLSSGTSQSTTDMESARRRLENLVGIGVDQTRRGANVFGTWIEQNSNPVLFKLVEILVKRVGREVPISEATRWVWDEEFNPVIHTPRLHTLVFRLRDLMPPPLRNELQISGSGLILTQSVSVAFAAPVKAPGELSDIGEWILSYVKKRGRIDNRTISKLRRCSPATAKREARTLKERGLIALKGRGRGAGYELN